jgi:hypothetical protein
VAVVTVPCGVAAPLLMVAVSSMTPSVGSAWIRSRSRKATRMTPRARSWTVAEPSGTRLLAGKGSPSKSAWKPTRWPTPTLRGSDVPKNMAWPSSRAARSMERLVGSVMVTDAIAG